MYCVGRVFGLGNGDLRAQCVRGTLLWRNVCSSYILTRRLCLDLVQQVHWSWKRIIWTWQIVWSPRKNECTEEWYSNCFGDFGVQGLVLQLQATGFRQLVGSNEQSVFTGVDNVVINYPAVLKSFLYLISFPILCHSSFKMYCYTAAIKLQIWMGIHSFLSVCGRKAMLPNCWIIQRSLDQFDWIYCRNDWNGGKAKEESMYR